MVSISFYLYEVGSARAPKGFPWWTAGMKIDPRVPNTLIRKDYSIVNFTNIYSVSTQIRYLSKPQEWYSNKIKLDLDSGLERPTTINTRTTFQSKTEPSRKRKESAESNQKDFESTEPTFRIENREKKSREIDGRSSCTSECLSSLVSSTRKSRAGVDVAGTLARGSLYTSTDEP